MIPLSSNDLQMSSTIQQEAFNRRSTWSVRARLAAPVMDLSSCPGWVTCLRGFLEVLEEEITEGVWDRVEGQEVNVGAICMGVQVWFKTWDENRWACSSFFLFCVYWWFPNQPNGALPPPTAPGLQLKIYLNFNQNRNNMLKEAKIEGMDIDDLIFLFCNSSHILLLFTLQSCLHSGGRTVPSFYATHLRSSFLLLCEPVKSVM